MKISNFIFRSFIFRSFMAGVSISIGGWAFLASDNRLTGSVLFAVGLLLVCVMGYNLYTGKICYLGTKGGFSVASLALVLLGNILATAFMGLLTRMGHPMLVSRAQEISARKLSEGFRVIPLAIMCNVLIFFAVHAYRTCKFQTGKFIAVILCVAVFVYCGFEHCVANSYYFFVAGFSLKHIPYLLLNILGNSVGGIAAYQLHSASVD